MKYLFLTFLFCMPLFANKALNTEQPFLFNQGDLAWKEYLEHCDLEQVIAGMRAAENKESFPCDKEELLAKGNLEIAEAFLANIADDHVIELIPTKLYYKQLQAGTGKIVEPHHTPLLTYSMWTCTPCEEIEIYCLDEPSYIDLEDTIPGFSYGVTGMREGEIRKLFIHPELAYGTCGKCEPNLLIIFQVEIIATDEECPLMENEDIF